MAKRRNPKRTFDKTPPRRHKPGTRKILVTLRLRHSINGRFYGPGEVWLTPYKAEAFLNTEHEAAQKEVNLQQQQAFIIGNRGGVMTKRQVPWAQFDDILGRSEVNFV